MSDGQTFPRVQVARDDERISALVDGGWYAVLASVDRDGATAEDVEVALQEVERELEHLVAVDRPGGNDQDARDRPPARADGGD